EVRKLRDAFKPLHENEVSAAVRKNKKAPPDVSMRFGEGQGSWGILLIFIWLWPLYRYYYSSKPANLLRVERRIIDWPVFLFGLTWLVAAAHYFARMGA